MTKKPSVEALKVSPERDQGGLDEQQRRLVYARARMNKEQIANVEMLVRDSGLRDVGQGALKNVRAQLASKKNRASRTVESHTCELLFAYELEMDPEVQAYYVQVPCRPITRVYDNGRMHVSQATLDFLVFYRDSVKLVECKVLSWLEDKSVRSTEWHLTDGRWSCTPYERWAVANGLSFQIWFPPWPLGVCLRNHEGAYAFKDVELTALEQRAVKHALAIIAVAPHSIDELRESVPYFSERLALWLIAHRKAFGLIQSTPIEMGERFYLYADQRQAATVDQNTLERIASGLQQLDAHDPLNTASATDFRRGLNRLEHLEAIATGMKPMTRRMSALARQVHLGVAEGISPLSTCLTRFADCGNRQPRLSDEQQDAIDFVIAMHWNRNPVRTLRALWFHLEMECEKRAIKPPLESTLNRCVQKQNPTKRALAKGGMRAYQSVCPSSDPRHRSLVAWGYGHTLHIDSSQLDNRIAPNLALLFPAETPTFYIGMDATTCLPMAHSFIFGPACTDGFAILIRDFVSRHGFLPRVIFADRGPENTSNWLKQLCLENGITLMHPPTAASRFNGLAENAIKRVNDDVAHEFRGSTEPDMKGRAVDGKFKSRKNAETTFLTIQKAFIAYVYGDLARTPLDGGGTPTEKKEESLARFGLMGTPHAFNDDLLIKTSVSIDFKGKATEKKGIRTGNGFFTSNELVLMLRTKQPQEVRQDCMDPSVLHVSIGGVWLKAFHRTAQSIALLSPLEKLFILLRTPAVNCENRKLKKEVSRERFARNLLLAARTGGEHLAPSKEEKEVEDESPSTDLPNADWDSLPMFDEE